ncbi:NADP-dependent phosphogluconate dehydrogenase [Candidatus Nomurabacteria bacterium]|nr:NADP-dependent phosphogluconate dehydrogenase [Candidatus Nomurabacteria bacterium]
MPQKPTSDFGLIGLGVMGANLARNVESRGFSVSVYNRSFNKTEQFLLNFEGNFTGFGDLKTFVQSLRRPRRIMIMVQAGQPVDAVIKALLPHIQKGDVIVDGGNSYYGDTKRREAALLKKGILYMGCGVSGGEDGALYGPSLMPGGSMQAWRVMKPILTKIAAKDFSEGPCVTHVGSGAAGHYVKMVHNGIEYAVMQFMAESYEILRKVYKLSPPEIADIFQKYNRGKLQSYLLEIALPVLRQKDELDKNSCCLVYHILDTASQKGTGKWASLDALERGVSTPTINEAVFARFLSSEKNLRVALSKKYTPAKRGKVITLGQFTKQLENALYAAMFSSYAQGYHLICKAAKEEGWKIDMKEISRIWEGGCIIRAKLLSVLGDAYSETRRHDEHLFALPKIQALMKKNVKDLRSAVASMSQSGVALPGFSSALYYFEYSTAEHMPANFIQGLRDYFGAHTYQRDDRAGTYHTDWDEG